MSRFEPLQHKNTTSLTHVTLTPSRRSFQRFVLSAVSPSESVASDRSSQPGQNARYRYSLADMPLLPPERENHTGLSDQLKAGIEALSGWSLDDVRVHYHSSKPGQVQALAYTQGTEIHVGPHQERYVPHEAWHVVQQLEQRVQPTSRYHGLPINTDQRLEREADNMGAMAVSLPQALLPVPSRVLSTAGHPSSPDPLSHPVASPSSLLRSPAGSTNGPIQGYFTFRRRRVSHPRVVQIEEVLRRANKLDAQSNGTYRNIALDDDNPTDLVIWLESIGLDKQSIGQLLAALGPEVEEEGAQEEEKGPTRKRPQPPQSLHELEREVGEGVQEEEEEPSQFLGTAPPTNPKGGTVMARRPSLVRQDSQGHLYPIRGTDFHIELRKANLPHLAEARLKSGNKDINVFKIGVTLILRLPSGEMRTVHGMLPQYWNSGLTQTSDSRDTAQDLTNYYAQRPPIPRDVPQESRLNANPPANAFAESSAKANNAAMWAHSETNAIADPQMPAYLTDLVNRLITEAAGNGEAVILTATLDGDSAPNSVCTNACRPAIEDLRVLLERIVRNTTAQRSPTLRLSAGFQVDGRVASIRFFAPNKALKEARKSQKLQNMDIPLLLGGPITLEMLPDQAASLGKNPFYAEKRKTTIMAADAPQAQQALIAWITGNPHHPLVSQLSACGEQREAIEAIQNMDLDALNALWTAIGAERHEQQTAYYRQTLLLMIWYLLAKGACRDVGVEESHRKPPPGPGAGGFGEGRTMAAF